MLQSSSPLFTVFTPTYNRAETLHRVYRSLQEQSFHDFEWLIVDDGSTDDTFAFVEIWQQEVFFPIRYVWQENAHKKTAFNRGVRMARGELFLCADSDDTFPPDALERFAKHWRSIAESDRVKFDGVCGLCQDDQGKVVGNLFPGGWGFDSNYVEVRHRYGVKGEKWGFSRTDVLRANPFPEFLPGHVPEGVVWTAIAAQYKTRFINEVVRVYLQGASNQLSWTATPESVAPGTLFWKWSVLSFELVWFWRRPAHFLLEAARWTRFRLHLNAEQARLASFLPSSFWGVTLVALMSPLGAVWWLFDFFRRR